MGRRVLVLGELAEVVDSQELLGLETFGALSNSDAPPEPYNPNTQWDTPQQQTFDPESPMPVTPPPSQSGWPAAAKPVKQGWMRGKEGLYILQRGDSISGLSRTYLGQYTRWKELWHYQDPEFLSKHPTADKVYEGELLKMPPEAIARAKGYGVFPAAAVPWGWLAGGVAAVGVLGGLGYVLASR